MKKKLRCQIDCANCAAKLEAQIQKIAGVEEASVNFMAQKLSLSAGDECFDEVLSEVKKLAKRIEPDAVIE